MIPHDGKLEERGGRRQMAGHAMRLANILATIMSVGTRSEGAQSFTVPRKDHYRRRGSHNRKCTAALGVCQATGTPKLKYHLLVPAIALLLIAPAALWMLHFPTTELTLVLFLCARKLPAHAQVLKLPESILVERPHGSRERAAVHDAHASSAGPDVAACRYLATRGRGLAHSLPGADRRFCSTEAPFRSSGTHGRFVTHTHTYTARATTPKSRTPRSPASSARLSELLPRRQKNPAQSAAGYHGSSWEEQI
mmetsp:Transcript_42142/g.113223  ORF Transcript_42142/g.113223 Transcript_42142/m.113223 type:complete len:252 (+) Transcript_42142:336-1091(+)